MLRYFSLWRAFFRNSLSLDMEFKANFLGGLFVDVVYYGSKFFFFTVIYSYVEGNDVLPEVIIGRISANGTSELHNIINKTIQYEKAQDKLIWVGLIEQD